MSLLKGLIVLVLLIGSAVGIVISARNLGQSKPTQGGRIGRRERAFCDLYGSVLTLIGTIVYVIFVWRS